MILQDQQKLLSFLGLFPFIALSALIWINPVWDNFILLIFILYSLFIHIFLCGSWWGIAREKNKSLITSIIFFFFPLILAFMLCLLEYVFEPSYGKSFKFILGPLVALMLAFEFGHIYEKKMLDLDDDYIELRFKLTFSVRICHLLMIGFIFTNQ
tara:strand:- start:7166 stop:7630 length:465 start_codon:yes stop_codon:yes gene_type:complete